MFSSLKISGFITGWNPSSAPCSWIRCRRRASGRSSPRRMLSAAIATACRPDEQKRLMVMPGTVSGRPASSTPMRATFMPCSASGMAQPMMASLMRLTSMPGHCVQRCAQHVREQVVGAGVAEHAARRLADRGAGGGDDVGVLHLLGHGMFSLLVVPAQAGISVMFGQWARITARPCAARDPDLAFLRS